MNPLPSTSHGPPAPCSPGPTLALHACTSTRCSTMWNRRSTIHATPSSSTVAVTRTAALLIATGCLVVFARHVPCAQRVQQKIRAVPSSCPQTPFWSAPSPPEPGNTRPVVANHVPCASNRRPHEHSRQGLPWRYREPLCGTLRFNVAWEVSRCVWIAAGLIYLLACWNVCTNEPRHQPSRTRLRW